MSTRRKLAALLLFSLAPACLTACALPFRMPSLDCIWASKTSPCAATGGDAQQAPPVAPANGSSASVAPTDAPLSVTLPEAIITGLANNPQFKVERIRPPITSTLEDEERAVFDPVFRADANRLRQRSSRYVVQQQFTGETGVSQFLPTGTTLDLLAGTQWNEDIPPGPDVESRWKSYPRFSVTQALLQGQGVAVNLVNLRKAVLDTQISLYELTGLAQTLTFEIENSYWDYFLALGQIDIYSRSLALAKRLVRETRQRIEIGQKAPSEIYFVQAEASTREQSLIDARSFQEKTRIRLLRLISPPSFSLWGRQLRLLTKPSIPKEPIENMSIHFQVAASMRPDINQARLEERKGQLDIVKTSNGLLPKLDLFLMLGRTGYSRSFPGSSHDITAGDGGLDFIANLSLNFPILNRKASAQYNRSVLELTLQKDAIDNLIQLSQQDLLLARTEIERAKDQITATTATVRFQIAKREAEIEKYRIGTSNAYRVAQAERDAVNSEIQALQARIDYLKGLTQFYFAEGSLLARRGVGVIPVGP